MLIMNPGNEEEIIFIKSSISDVHNRPGATTKNTEMTATLVVAAASNTGTSGVVKYLKKGNCHHHCTVIIHIFGDINVATKF